MDVFLVLVELLVSFKFNYEKFAQIPILNVKRIITEDVEISDSQESFNDFLLFPNFSQDDELLFWF